MGVSENPVGAPGGWKARTAFDADDQSLHSPDLLLERTWKVLSSELTLMVTVVLVAGPEYFTSPEPDSRSS